MGQILFERGGLLDPGALADLLLVEGDPLRDLSTLQEPDKHLALVMKGGDVVLER